MVKCKRIYFFFVLLSFFLCFISLRLFHLFWNAPPPCLFWCLYLHYVAKMFSLFFCYFFFLIFILYLLLLLLLLFCNTMLYCFWLGLHCYNAMYSADLATFSKSSKHTLLSLSPMHTNTHAFIDKNIICCTLKPSICWGCCVFYIPNKILFLTTHSYMHTYI